MSIAESVFDASRCSPYSKARPSANSTVSNSGNFTVTVPKVASPDPTKDGVIRQGASISPTRWKVVPYGVGIGTNTFLMRLIGWDEITGLWVPTMLWQGTCTLTASQPGLVGAAVDNTNLFCDTIVTSKGTDGVESQPFSPANGNIGSLVIDVKGAQFVEIQFDTNGSATSANALIKML